TELLAEIFDADLGHDRSVRKMAHDDEGQRAGQDSRERVGVERQRERLHQHEHADADQRRGARFPRATAEQVLSLRCCFHRRSAPKVMPRSRCRRSRTVNTTIGIRNSVVPAATAGQSCPPSPMMMGMNGGAVCASPEVSSTANAYSFHAKMRQKMAVATMPVVHCGSTTFTNACSRV